MRTQAEVKEALAGRIDNRIRSLGMNGIQVAAHLGLPQPRVSELRNNRGQHSVDGMIQVLEHLGVKVEISLENVEVSDGLPE